MKAPVRVAIVEPQALYKDSLTHVFRRSADIDVKADVTDSTVEVALVGTSVLDLGTVDSLMRIRASAPGMKVCALVVPGNDRSFEIARMLCADGLTSVHSSPADVISTVVSVGRGGRGATDLLTQWEQRPRAPAKRGLSDLSRRETEVIKLIVDGMSNKQISSALVLSEKTVKNHVSRIFSKLNVTARTQAAVVAMRQGMADS